MSIVTTSDVMNGRHLHPAALPLNDNQPAGFSRIQFNIMIKVHERDTYPSELAEDFQTTKQALLKHLNMLRNEGLLTEIKQRGDSRIKILKLTPKGEGELRRILIENAKKSKISVIMEKIDRAIDKDLKKLGLEELMQ